MAMLVNVTSSGAILLGDSVCCDGFHHNYKVRVQTHFHHDHMTSFDSSKGMQDIYMSEPTFALLISRYNADLPYRKGENIFTVSVPGQTKLENYSLEFYDSRHMLGAVQVAIQLENGYRLGYSGDFSWPLEPNQVMKVDELVVDATYGSPNAINYHPLEEIKERFWNLAKKHMSNSPIEIRAHGGTLQHTLSCLDNLNNWPIITEKEYLKREICVYQNFGYPISRQIYSSECEHDLVREIMNDKKFIRVASFNDLPGTNLRYPTFIITAMYRHDHDSVTEINPNLYTIPISDHADFNGTLAFVKSTGAKKVVCDNYRSEYAKDLAFALKSRLGLEAIASDNKPCFAWGV
jgi:putative mRNA 3-end processing factor